MIRLAHFSDIHITAPTLDWTFRDWFNKRHAAWFNFRWLGRRHRFHRADEVLTCLVAEIGERRPDHLIFSGDATALGFESEIRRAAQMLKVGDTGMPPGLAIPGNHDYCTHAAAASGHFERYFAPWQTGTRLDGDHYPFAQRVGHLTLVAVNSSVANHLPWDALGKVGATQCDRLKDLLAKLEPGPRILVTHYPICLANGRPENFTHGLRDVTQLVKVAAAGGVSLWLHGHRHHAYHFHELPLAPFPVICSGSATQTNLWSYCEYSVDGLQWQMRRRIFDPIAGTFRDGPLTKFQLRGGQAELLATHPV
jgi:3',5'-cyclic AMP phosphodiesterase CpdA